MCCIIRSTVHRQESLARDFVAIQLISMVSRYKSQLSSSNLDRSCHYREESWNTKLGAEYFWQFLRCLEVFRQSFFFSIRTKTKEKPKNKIVAKKSDIQTLSQPWFIMFTLNLLFMSLRSYRMIPNVHVSDSSDKGHYTILAFLYWLKSFSSRLNSAPSYMYMHWVMVHWFMA